MSDYIFSKGGITQGDPLSMCVYPIGTLPLIQSLHSPQSWNQLWYVDDASAGGLLSDLCNWFCFRVLMSHIMDIFLNHLNILLLLHQPD